MGGVIEVERKRQLSDGGARLTGLLVVEGWVAADPVVEVDTYYSRPDVDFMETVECLRVRRRGVFAEVTYKPPSTAATHGAGGVVSKRETNVLLAGAGQAEAADSLLGALGMRLLVQVEKHRTAYRHPRWADVTVAVDRLAGVGAFVETEVLSDDALMAAATVANVEHDLDLDDCPIIVLPYRDLAMRAQPAPVTVSRG
ncbi:class IV adenylate cyclase [Streptomyces sp. NPDC017454]|uniref:class IV adenylate cyclase n=1 Tax=Streptomyces sp. NPDC017454 TaxID=3364997 RepID=UPI003799DB88